MWDKIIYMIVIIIVTYILKQLLSETPNFVKFKSKFLVFYIWTSVTAVILMPFFVFNPKNVKNSLFGSQIVKHVTKVIEVKWLLRNGRVLAEDRGAVVVSNHQSSIDILDGNLVKAEKDKQIKYFDFVRMWYVDSAIITIGTDSLDNEWLNNQEPRPTPEEALVGSWVRGLIQKAVLLDTACIVRTTGSLDPIPDTGMFNIWHVADKVAAIARKEIFYVWPFGLAAYLAGVVFIDRNNSKDAYKQLKMTSEIMIKNKTKIWLFPEGTRNKDFTKLLPFKKGAFNIAVAAQVPIIPVVFSPYYFINRKKYIFNKGHAVIQCLEPVPTVGLTMEDVPELITKVRNTMDAAYKELSKEVLSALPPNYPLATD